MKLRSLKSLLWKWKSFNYWKYHASVFGFLDLFVSQVKFLRIQSWAQDHSMVLFITFIDDQNKNMPMNFWWQKAKEGRKAILGDLRSRDRMEVRVKSIALGGSSITVLTEFAFTPSHKLLGGVKILSSQSFHVNENMYHLYYMWFLFLMAVTSILPLPSRIYFVCLQVRTVTPEPRCLAHGQVCLGSCPSTAFKFLGKFYIQREKKIWALFLFTCPTFPVGLRWQDWNIWTVFSRKSPPWRLGWLAYFLFQWHTVYGNAKALISSWWNVLWMVWVGRELKDHPVPTPLPWVGTLFSRPSCLDLHPSQPAPGMGHPLFLWATWSSVSPSSQQRASF